MTDIRKVKEGLQMLYQEMWGLEVSVEDFEDVTVGWETQIVAFTFKQSGEALDLVARIYSGLSSGRKAEREFNIMHHLASAGYPVPRVYSYEAEAGTLEAPFIVMERIRGGTLWDVFFSTPVEKRKEVLAVNSRLMAQLHEVSPAKVLPGFSRVKTRHHVLSRIEAETGEVTTYGLNSAFSPLVTWLQKNIREVIESPLCLIHQDFHPRNVLLRPDGSPVVIDWSTCVVGDFREDLCWTALLAGSFIDEPLKAAVYESYSDVSSRELADLPYFEALAGLRRLADAAVTVKAGAEARGMRPETKKEIEGNRPHYKKIIKWIEDLTEIELTELSRWLQI